MAIEMDIFTIFTLGNEEKREVNFRRTCYRNIYYSAYHHDSLDDRFLDIHSPNGHYGRRCGLKELGFGLPDARYASDQTLVRSSFVHFHDAEPGLGDSPSHHHVAIYQHIQALQFFLGAAKPGVL
jgi:hypothetical protein